MKKLHLLFGILFFVLIGTNSFARTEKRSIDPFNSVSLRVSGDLYIEQGNDPSIEITASDETLRKIIVEIIDQKLIVRFSIEDRFFSSFKPGDIEIHVVTPQINNLSIQGPGNIISNSKIESNYLDLNITGSGDIRLSDVKSEQIDIQISGSGDVVVAGDNIVKNLDIEIAGSGDVMANKLKTESCTIRIAGSGDCDVDVVNFIDAKIYGSGDIVYSGNPEVKSSISGSGEIHN